MKELNVKQTACSIDVTEACNLACDYCFTHSKHIPKKLDPIVGKQFIKWWLPQTDEHDRRVHIQFWGGEPLLAWDTIQELVLYTKEFNKKSGLRRSIECGGTTNGVLATPDKIEWGLRHNCLWMFSIDGIKEVHDKHRKFPDGSGSFDVIIKNFKEAKRLIKRLKLRASISAFSVPYFSESIKYFVEELGQTDLLFSPVFEDNWTEEVLEQMGEQFEEVLKYAIQKAKDGTPLQLKHIDDIAIRGCNKQEPGNPCGAGRTYCGMSVDGFIFPCHRFNKHGLTELERSALPTIIGMRDGNTKWKWWNDEWRAKFLNFKDEHKQKCLECDLLTMSVCGGGCPAVNYDMTGNLHESPQSQCDYNKVLHDVGMKYHDMLEAANLLQEPIHKDACFCNNMCYSEGPGKAHAMQKKFLELSKRILQTMDQDKTEEHRKLELEVIERTIKIL